MTSREQFEAEMAKLNDVLDMRRAKNGDMEYMAWDVALAWKMWQASREAVDVQLPDRRDYEETLSDHELGFNIALELCAEAIRAAGIKVKGE